MAGRVYGPPPARRPPTAPLVAGRPAGRLRRFALPPETSAAARRLLLDRPGGAQLSGLPRWQAAASCVGWGTAGRDIARLLAGLTASANRSGASTPTALAAKVRAVQMIEQRRRVAIVAVEVLMVPVCNAERDAAASPQAPTVTERIQHGRAGQGRARKGRGGWKK